MSSVVKSGKVVEHNLSIDSDLIFKEDDIYVTDILARMLRYIFVQRKITYDQFNKLYHIHADRLNLSPAEANYRRNNTIKAVLKDTISIKMFMYVIISVLNLNPTNMSMTFEPEDKKKFKVSLDL